MTGKQNSGCFRGRTGGNMVTAVSISATRRQIYSAGLKTSKRGANTSCRHRISAAQSPKTSGWHAGLLSSCHLSITKYNIFNKLNSESAPSYLLLFLVFLNVQPSFWQTYFPKPSTNMNILRLLLKLSHVN